MKIIRTVVWGIVAAICLIGIGMYIFLRVRDSRSNNIPVHQKSIAIVKIAVDDIKLDIAMNALMNPKYYWTMRADTTDGKSFLFPDLGVFIPANIYFFSLDDKTDIWYTMLKISDRSILQDFLQRHMILDSIGETQQGQEWSVLSKDGRLAFWGDDGSALMATSLSGKVDVNQLTTLWHDRSKSMIPLRDLNNFNFELLDANVVYHNIKNHSQGKLDFGTGKMIFELIQPNSLITFAKNAKARDLPKENILNFYSDADLRPLFKHYSTFFGRYNIPIDTLVNYYGGYMDVQWEKGDVEQQETIVTYDYDENFEPIEKKEIRKEIVPNLVLTYRISPHILSYIPDKIFYKFHKRQHNDLLSLATDSAQNEDIEFIKKKAPFQLTYRYDPVVLTYLGWISLLKPIRSIDVQGGQLSKAGGAKFTGEVGLVHKDIHALFQLLNE